MQEFQPFPTYDGFVMADPEGRWIEIMQYTHESFRVQEFTNQLAGECGLRMVGFVEIVKDLAAMSAWYQNALGLRELRCSGNGQSGWVELVDNAYDAQERNTVMVLSSALTEEEQAIMADKGPYISAILYEAKDIDKAFEDATWAGMSAVQAPTDDDSTGWRLARLREPSGNLIYLRQTVAA
jgi:predicted enzyme related to lactoylglutathione lyase